MKTIITKFIIAIAILTASNFNVLSQEKKINIGEVPVQLVKEDLINKKAEQKNFKTGEMTVLEKEMKKAKEKGDKNEVINLQKKYDAISGAVTVTPEKMNMKSIRPEDLGLDNIYANNIFSTNDQFSIVDMATATDHRGSQAGRIWTVWTAKEDYEVQNASSFGLAYSDDHGLSWTVQYLFATDENDYMSGLDIELIEDDTDKNFMWIVFDPNILIVVNLNTGASYAYSLNWPSGVNTSYTIHPRIVSDNSKYPDIPFVYIVAQHWVDDPNYYNGYIEGEATAKCVNPYTVTPIISFGNSYVTYSDSYKYYDDYTSDVAYYRNGASDSVMIIINNGSNRVDLYSNSIFAFNGNSYSNEIGNLNPQYNTIPEQRAYIATNGGYNKIMIVIKREFGINDWDVAYYRSTNGSGGWQQGYIDFSGANAYGDARIIGERNNSGKFHVAYIKELNSQISYCSSVNYNWNSPVFPYSNLKSYISNDPYFGLYLGNPAPGYSTLINEPCMAVWLDSTGKNLKSSAGCSGPFTQSTKTLFMFGAIQGLYDANKDLMIYDTVTVYLRNSTFPFAKIDSSKKEMYGPGTGQNFTFLNAQNNVPYYIEVKHRNALETWSADPVTFISENASIAFSVDAIYAYGNNEIQVDSSPYNVFAFYSGDINQDGTIDASDLSGVENDVSNSVSGYIPADLNGDDFVDASDLSIVENNVALGVSVVTP